MGEPNGADVRPSIVETLVRWGGKRYLTLIEQGLDENLAIVVIGGTIEHQLHIARHREQFLAAPVAWEGVDGIFGQHLTAGAELHETDEWQQHKVVTVAKIGAMIIGAGDDRVGSCDDVEKLSA